MSAPKEPKRVPDVLVAAVVLAVVVFVVFCPSISGGFIYDDNALVVANDNIRSLGQWKSWFQHDFWNVNPEFAEVAVRLRYFRPLVTASYAIDYSISHLDPFGFHLTNIVAHIAVAVLSLLLLRRWIGSVWPALVATALFVLHPTKAESVAWISGRTDVLCCLAMLVATTGAAMRLRGRRAGWWIELAATAVAYGTKEGAVALAAFVGVEAWVAAGKPPIDGKSMLAVLRAAAPQLAIAFVYLALRAIFMPFRPGPLSMSTGDHVAFFFETIGAYVLLAIAPHDESTLRALIRTENGAYVHDRAVIAVGVAFLLMLPLLALLRRRAPVVVVSVAFFVVTLLPVSNLVMPGLGSLYAERFLYVPLLGLCLLAGSGIAALREGRARRLGYAGGVLCISVFAVGAMRHAFDFADEARFWRREGELHPEALEPRKFAIGRALAEHQYKQAFKLVEEARAQAQRWYGHTGAELDYLEQLIEVRSLLTPDLRTADLGSMAEFFRELSAPDSKTAQLHAAGIELSIAITGPFVERARMLRPRALKVQADIASRLAHDEEAKDLCVRARAACSTCKQIAIQCALVHARAGDYPASFTILERIDPAVYPLAGETRKTIASAELLRKQAEVATGPVQLTLQASELSRLESWGRAYAILSPHRTQIEAAPGFALAFAELAFRAGDTAVAREVLAKVLPEEKREEAIQKWARTMGWI